MTANGTKGEWPPRRTARPLVGELLSLLGGEWPATACSRQRLAQALVQLRMLPAAPFRLEAKLVDVEIERVLEPRRHKSAVAPCGVRFRRLVAKQRWDPAIGDPQ